MNNADGSRTLEAQHYELWFNVFDPPRALNDPDFFEPADFPWVQHLERNWFTVRKELENLLRESEDRLVPYFDNGMVPRRENWKVFPFFYWGWKIRKNCKHCPETVRLLRSIPHMTTGSFSVLEPNTRITPHVGDTNAVARCHLGLVVPASLPECGLRVGSEVRSWEEGKLLMFCDAKPHSAWNETPHRRIVLFVDVVRPEFADRAARVCRMMRLDVALKYMAVKIPILSRFQPILRKLLLPVVAPRWLN